MDLTNGSKVLEAGGTDEEERVNSVDFIARAGVVVVVRDCELANLPMADITDKNTLTVSICSCYFIRDSVTCGRVCRTFTTTTIKGAQAFLQLW